MDDAVVRAMARWPNVPDVYGWLELDRRGQWLIKGERIGNDALRAFIARNYMSTPDGAYAFQNGPQRVFVRLAYTPWVASLDGGGQLCLQTGVPVTGVSGAFLDETGSLLLHTQSGIALVDDRDLEALCDTLAGADGARLDDDERERRIDGLIAGQRLALSLPFAGAWHPIARVDSASVAARFSFVPDPGAPR